MKLIMTPDYGLSDIWHFNYPLKYLLSQSLKSGKFPLWTDAVGNGFPITAEGQIGAFSPVNWFIFALFPMPTAFMLALVGAFMLALVGSYLFARSLNLSRASSIAASAFASFNGYFIVQMTHLNLLQSFSFIPWAFFCWEKFMTSGKKTYLLWLSVVLANMILFGYPQTLINTGLMLLVYAVIRFPRKFFVHSLRLGAAAAGAVLLGAIQVFPLLELVGQSDTLAAAARQRFIHPLPPTHLVSVFDPFVFGDPARGTYPIYGDDWGMFWENMLYVGILPLVGVSGLLAVRFFKRKLDRKRHLFPLTGVLAVFLASLVLSLGKYLPTAVLFKLPPLSFTRISSRFLVFTNVSLGYLGAYGLAALGRSRRIGVALVVLLTLLNIAQIAWVFRSYHLFVDSNRWLEPPEVIDGLSRTSRIISLGQSARWNDTFLTKGWQGQEDAFFQFRNSLDPNSNLIFGVRQIGVYAQQLPRRQELIQLNMGQDGLLGEHIRAVFGVTHVFDARLSALRVIEYGAVLPDIRLAENIVRVRDLNEALGAMSQSGFNPANDTLWEASTMPGENEEVVVMNRSYYPGWRAWLSGKEIPIYPVNINQQAVIVPEGTDISLVTHIYDPWTYKAGGAMSLVSIVGWMLLWRKFRYNSV